ncbi:HAMP domain-containing protein, partial [Pseudomonas syringae]
RSSDLSLDADISAGARIVGLAIDSPDRAKQELGTLSSAFTQLEGQVSSLSDLIEDNAKASGERTRQTTLSANGTLLVVLSISILLLLVQGHWVTRSFMIPLASASRIADSVAHGDLREPIAESSGRDEASMLIRSLASMPRVLRSRVEVARG